MGPFFVDRARCWRFLSRGHFNLAKGFDVESEGKSGRKQKKKMEKSEKSEKRATREKGREEKKRKKTPEEAGGDVGRPM